MNENQKFHLRQAVMHLPHPQVTARVLAHRFGIPWHRVNELSDELASSVNETEERIDFASGESNYFGECGRIMTEMVDRIFAKCGSPIEELFLAHLAGDCFGFNPGFDFEDGAHCGEVEPGLVFLQHRVLEFRLDFAISRDGKTGVAIELDGHEFHERTKQQAQRDKSRERKIQAEGWHILRFTGSEIWKDPSACVYEATATAFKILGPRASKAAQ